MNRKELLELALKETGSLVQAIELVKQWDLMTTGSSEQDIPSLVPEAAPAAPVKLEQLTYERKPKTLSDTPRTRKRWTESEIQVAETMFNNKAPFAKVAQALDRTEKSIRDALAVGLMKPTVDPRNPRLRAAAIKGLITRGGTPSDWNQAQKLIDENP